ncbi:MAG: type II toxin-antitoxin system mRNA interferase toxin, RelE/StbE family [Bacteroidota bacterium]
MINLIWDEAFNRKYRKLIKNNSSFHSEFQIKMELFVANQNDPILKTHKLSGKLNDCWASSIDYHFRIVFKKIDENNILLLDIGSHDEVY